MSNGRNVSYNNTVFDIKVGNFKICTNLSHGNMQTEIQNKFKEE